MVSLSRKRFVPDPSFEHLEGDGPFLQFEMWLRSFFLYIRLRTFFLYIWLEILFMWQHLLTYFSSKAYQQEGKENIYQSLVSYIDAEVRETQECCVKKCEKWRKMRENTVAKVGEVAERVKVLNDGVIPFQIVCKAISMGAKLSMFGGPFVMLLGSGASVLANVGYNKCTKRQIEELEKMCAEVQRALQRDRRMTKRFFYELTKMSQPAKVCIRKFHSVVVNGFFDSVPEFRSFKNSANAIKNIEDPQSITDFIKLLFKEEKNRRRNPSFRSSISALLTCNYKAVELINAQMPKVICSAAVGYSVVNGVKAGSCVPLLQTLNILTMIKDFVVIIRKLVEFGKYPQLSKDLKAIKSKLEQEMKGISKMAEQIENVAVHWEFQYKRPCNKLKRLYF